MLVLIFFVGMFINRCVRQSSGSSDFWDIFGIGAPSSEHATPGFHWNLPGVNETTRPLPDVTIPAAGMTAITVSNTDGEVVITGKDGQSDIMVKQTVSLTGTGRRADEDIAAYRLDQKTDAGTLTLKPVVPAGSSLTVSFDITVPKAMSVAADTTDGRISIAGTDGSITAHAEDGSVSASNIAVDSADFSTTDGSITVSNVSAKSGAAQTTYTLNVKTGDGSVTLSDITLPLAKADVSSNDGSVTLKSSAFSALRVKAGDGSVTFSGVKSPMTVQSASGSVTATDCSGRMEIACSDGSVHLSGIKDEVVADTTSGTITASVPGATPPLRLETSDGSLDLTLFSADDFTIRAFAPKEQVHNSTGLAQSESGGVITIGGGAAVVTLKTVGGQINISRGGTK